MEIGRAERRIVLVDVTAALDDGTPVELFDVSTAMLPARTQPDADTAWSAADYADGTATVVLAGPEADDTDAHAVPATGGDLWVRVVDDPETITVRAERIRVL